MRKVMTNPLVYRLYQLFVPLPKIAKPAEMAEK
jgi:hypothetical protein